MPCGTPVLAATAGTVEIDTTQSWAGRWLVKIVTGPTTVATWYAHMQALDVTAGQVIAAGEVIGQAGAEGNSTGCHLHFEVHLKNGSIYGPDNVNPTPWLDTNVGKPTPVASLDTAGSSGVGATPTAGSFRVASMNALGNSHTAPGGNKHGYAPGPVRMRGVVSLLDGYGVSLVGFQELQGPQAAAFGTLHGSDWALFHARGDSENSIAWRTDTWQVVSTSLVGVPYFDGNTRRIPLVGLRLRATGQTVWMLNTHNPADTPRYHHQRRFRVRAIAIERRVIARIQARGQAVLFTGDLNDRAEAFCPLTDGGLMGSYLGGTNPDGPACQPPSPAPIDWIFATSHVVFESSTVDNTPRDTELTDHPMALAQAHLN